MQIACEVRRVLSKNPNRIQPGQFKLKFGTSKPKKLSVKEATKLAKAKWLSAVGYITGKNKT